jgi:uncharacterized glyoxalase superfamily protein PhnB
MNDAAQQQPNDQRKIPVKGGLVAYLEVEGALKAAEFYTKAFGAELAGHHPPDDQGRTMHVHLYVNGSSLMLGDPYPEHGYPHQAAQGYSLTLMVGDTDAAYARATGAGCASMMAPADMFWGDRYAQVRDPFGVIWAFNQAKN